MTHSKTKAQRMGGARPRNHGDGDQESARRLTHMEQHFVDSRRGERTIEQAGDVVPDEARELEQAEGQGRAPVRGEDPAGTRHRDGDDDDSSTDDS